MHCGMSSGREQVTVWRPTVEPGGSVMHVARTADEKLFANTRKTAAVAVRNLDQSANSGACAVARRGPVWLGLLRACQLGSLAPQSLGVPPP